MGILASPSWCRGPRVRDRRMILMKCAAEAGEFLVRSSELRYLPVSVFAGHHGTCPFKCDLHIQYVFRYTMSLIVLECLATNFVAWMSMRVNLGWYWARMLRLAASCWRVEYDNQGSARGAYEKASSY